MIARKALFSETHYSEQNALLGSLPSPTGWELAFPDLLGFKTMDPLLGLPVWNIPAFNRCLHACLSSLSVHSSFVRPVGRDLMPFDR